MSNKQTYRQCKLERPIENGKLIDVAWIPAVHAKIGKTLTIKSKDENNDGWVVVEVGGSMDFDELTIQRDAQKRWEHVLDHGVRE